MSEELIKRLRKWAKSDLGLIVMYEAADTIEALEAENERLKNILRDCDPESMSWLDARDAALGETE